MLLTRMSSAGHYDIRVIQKLLGHASQRSKKGTD
ncbi:MAG: hypothetical protein FD174_314 [Geobacteraceae bacterium]|nr:MAG: hypothetical protein FD174_314 [Geobacteraceae bacterium]